jgi:serine phosphatase RsbU (regulator of sigma subunit)
MMKPINEDMDFFQRYENTVTHGICRILRYIFLVFPALLILTIAGIFYIELSYFYIVIPLGFVVCFLPTLMLKLHISKAAIKSISVISIGSIVCILSTNVYVGIYITYILMTVLAVMYFDKTFTIRIALLGYVFMVIGLYIRAPELLNNEAYGGIPHSDFEWFVSYTVGYTIEYIVISVFLISIASRAKRLLADLKESGDVFARERAEKERIGAELTVATQIQASMLPCIFPAFPERKEFDIYASMEPAKEVGGDFYDFFLIDENTLAVVIADVSGKGVPAALFMVIAKTLIQNTALSGKRPEVVFGIVNKMLCENNEAGMFVTAFLAYIDLPSGKCTFVNAGHNPPLLKTPKGTFDWLRTKPGFVLAGDEQTFYFQHELVLKPGDMLFLYTDGVTEAVNNENQLFGEQSLLETANYYPDLPLKEFTLTIKGEIDSFAEGAEQADDITMLTLRYKGLEDYTAL